MWNYETNFWSHPINGKILDINIAITVGTITIEISYVQLEEILAAVNICVCLRRNIKHREFLID